MQAKQFLALALALCCASAVTATINMNDVCLLVGDGVSLASGGACNTYYTCSGGVATLQACESPLYFDKDTQACQPQSTVSCLGSTQNACAGQAVGTWVPVPGSCTDFYYCGVAGATRGQCPTNENFDSSTQTCKFSSELPCEPITNVDGDSATNAVLNLCTFIMNGMYFGSPSSCSTWNICNNNAMTSGTCGTGLVYDVASGRCNYKSQWGCSQVTNDPDLIGASGSIPVNGGACTTSGTMKAAPSCAGYYLCDGSFYMLQQCTNGLYFDTISQACVSRLQARNDCDRCAGTTDSFVNAYSTTDCTGYLYCVKGVEQSSGTCTNGYFDEVAGACVVGEEPQFACCNPTGSTGTTVPDVETTTLATTVKAGATIPAAPSVPTTVKAAPSLPTTLKPAV